MPEERECIFSSGITPHSSLHFIFSLLCLVFITSCSVAPPARYLALGDSYTIGQSVPESDRWPIQLIAALKQKGLNLGPPQIIARTGWTTADLLAAMDLATLQKHYDYVTLMIGVNDQFQHLPIDGFRTRLDTLLDRSVALAGDASHVIVISIPDWGVTPFAQGQDRADIAKQIDAFNVVYAEEATKRHVAWVDVTAISRRAADDASLVAEDGLHPSGKMYALWTTDIANAIKP